MDWRQAALLRSQLRGRGAQSGQARGNFRASGRRAILHRLLISVSSRFRHNLAPMHRERCAARICDAGRIDNGPEASKLASYHGRDMRRQRFCTAAPSRRFGRCAPRKEM
jgi:hypothetical protein